MVFFAPNELPCLIGPALSTLSAINWIYEFPFRFLKYRTGRAPRERSKWIGNWCLTETNRWGRYWGNMRRRNIIKNSGTVRPGFNFNYFHGIDESHRLACSNVSMWVVVGRPTSILVQLRDIPNSSVTSRLYPFRFRNLNIFTQPTVRAAKIFFPRSNHKPFRTAQNWPGGVNNRISPEKVIPLNPCLEVIDDLIDDLIWRPEPSDVRRRALQIEISPNTIQVNTTSPKSSELLIELSWLDGVMQEVGSYITSSHNMTCKLLKV